MINYLKTPRKYFIGSKTYKKRDAWISELDTCVASVGLISKLNEFTVFFQRSNLPSDHAPVAVTVSTTGADINNILARAVSLGDHATLYSTAGKCKLIRKPIQFHVVTQQ